LKGRAIYGGDDVSRPQIDRNYYRNLYQVDKRYKYFDKLQIVDTSASDSHKVLAPTQRKIELKKISSPSENKIRNRTTLHSMTLQLNNDNGLQT